MGIEPTSEAHILTKLAINLTTSYSPPKPHLFPRQIEFYAQIAPKFGRGNIGFRSALP